MICIDGKSGLLAALSLGRPHYIKDHQDILQTYTCRGVLKCSTMKRLCCVNCTKKHSQQVP